MHDNYLYYAHLLTYTLQFTLIDMYNFNLNLYINSKYEGQRDQQDRGVEFLPNEVEQVRRHHEMLSRLIGE